MNPALNLPLLSRVLSQPWALRRETLVSLTQALLGGESAARTDYRGSAESAATPRYRGNAELRPPEKSADTTFRVRQWDAENERVITAPLKTQAGYTILNWEGVDADDRGMLPPAPEGVTVLLVWGVLGRAWSALDRWWLDAIDVDELTASIAATPAGSTVVLWFRSPGGIVTGIPEAAAELRRLGQTRRLLAFTDDLCASAAYWLAAQCERITATPTAEVGSIGVYLAFYDFCGWLEKNGVKLELFKAGELKAIGLLGNPLDDPAREHLMAGVREAYALFTADVLAQRALADATMQGQTLSGAKALAANLCDGFQPSASSFFAYLAAGAI